MKSSILIIFALITLSIPQASAQVVHQLNEVLVEGKAHIDAIEAQKKALSSKIVISKRELNNFGHRTVGDVLKRMPRIFIQGPPSFNRNIMMGGLDKQFQCVLIDGERPAGGEDYRDLKLDRIPTDMVEEIEIIYNPPAEWGADAAMGVINIKLKDAPEKRFIRTNIELDHTSTEGGLNPYGTVSYGDKKGKLSFITSYSFNDFNRINVNNYQEDDIKGSERDDIWVQVNGFTGNLKYQINDNDHLKFKTFFSNYQETLDFIADIKKNSEGLLRYNADTAADKKIRRLHTQTLEYFKSGDNYTWKNTVMLSQHFDSKDRFRITEKTSGIMETLEDEAQENTESVLKSDLKIIRGHHTLKAGLRFSGLWRDYSRLAYEKVQGRKYWDDIVNGSYTLNEYRGGTYLADEINWDKLSLAPSLRLDYDYRSYTTPDATGDFQYLSFNPSLHSKYRANQTLFFKADISRQISRPPFNNQVPIDKVKHKKSTIERGNKDLKPSHALNFGLSAEKFIHQHSYISIRGFYTDLQDEIEQKFVGNDEKWGYSIIQSVNVESATVWGFDFDTKLQLIDQDKNQLSLSSNLSVLGSEVKDASTGKFRRLNEQPNWITNSSLDYLNTPLNIQFSIGLNHVGERRIAGGTDEGTIVAPLIYEPYTQLDARLKYFLNNWSSIFINATNLLDETMDITQGGVSASEIVGRNIRIGFSATL